MVFSSLLFIVGFLPIFLAVYYASPRCLKNLVALVASYLFYAWGEPLFAVFLLASSLADYFLSRVLARQPADRASARKAILVVSLVLNVGCLLYFKYANFFTAQYGWLSAALGGPKLEWQHVRLPLAISFFTFQKLSYMVDVYRGSVPPARSPLEHALYVALFPRLLAGPIIRYHDIAGQLQNRTHTATRFLEGVWRFSIGLGKKVLIANALRALADTAFGLDTAALPVSLAWLGMVAYSFQIYFDFSGYSDMAIGLGRMMGFEFLENFNRPYIAVSFTDFWRRWHISLSNWMREYLYIPLGGNRVPPWRAYMNLWIVFLLSGLWHGAAWTFIAWGAFHGLFLTLDKIPRPARWARPPAALRRIMTFLLVSIGWVLFRCDSIAHAGRYLARLVSVRSIGQIAIDPGWAFLLDGRTVTALAVAAVLGLVPLPVGTRDGSTRPHPAAPWLAPVRAAFAMALLFLCVCWLANEGFSPFIYFRF